MLARTRSIAGQCQRLVTAPRCRPRRDAPGRSRRASADTPATLRRGVNITHWFRYPPSRDPAALRSYLDDAAIQQIKDAGFDFVRLPVQPDLLNQSDAVTEAVARLQRHGLSVIVSLHPVDWHLETAPSDQARLLSAGDPSPRRYGGPIRR